MSLKTDYKDEILRDGEDRRYNLVDENGRVVYSNIKLDKAYTPQQEGDEFNAQDVNNITKSINQLSPPNLLINGDFQVNQRGQSNYTCDGTKRVYGVDMWSFSKADTFMRIVENGIETNAPISQMFNKLKSGVKYTVVCSIDNVIHTKSIVGGTYDTDTSQTIMYLTFNDVERILITPNDTQTINYIDLFEGEIVYKHQKEDYAIALTRCQRYVWKNCDMTMSEIIQQLYLGGLTFPIEMVNTPSVKIIRFENTSGINKSNEIQLINCNKKGISYIQLKNATSLVYQYSFIFSCEPL